MDDQFRCRGRIHAAPTGKPPARGRGGIHAAPHNDEIAHCPKRNEVPMGGAAYMPPPTMTKPHTDRACPNPNAHRAAIPNS